MKYDKELAKQPIKTTLNHGDSYVDEPVLKEVQVYVGKGPMTGTVVNYYKRVPLRWVKRTQ